MTSLRALTSLLGFLNDGIERFARLAGAVGIALAVLGLTAAVGERFTLGTGFDLLVDLPPMLVPWVVMLLIAPLARRHLHVAVDLLPALFSPRWLRLLRKFVWAVIGVSSAVIAWGSGWAVVFFARMGETLALSVDMPLWWFYLSFPVGFALLTVAALEMFLRELIGLPLPAPDGQPG